uniref:RNA binding motif protein 26 n=1 Tax=Mastacembelus armatus TaxID=205130 RepID=A0A7N9APE4_9TELE
MIIENLDALKTWLSETLEPICDADPSALAKYVVALVKKDKSEKELKALCIDQLDVCASAWFRLFNTFFFCLCLCFTNEIFVFPNFRRGDDRKRDDRSRKREYERNPPRRDSYRDRYNRRRGRSRSYSRSRSRSWSKDRIRDHSGKLKYDHDRVERSESGEGYNPAALVSTAATTHFPVPTLSSTITVIAPTHHHSNTTTESWSDFRPEHPVDRGPFNRGPHPQRKRCRDYDEKGFCMRGDMCPFDHGNDPVVVEDVNLPSMLPFQPPPIPGVEPPPPPGLPPPPPLMNPPPVNLRPPVPPPGALPPSLPPVAWMRLLIPSPALFPPLSHLGCAPQFPQPQQHFSLLVMSMWLLKEFNLVFVSQFYFTFKSYFLCRPDNYETDVYNPEAPSITNTSRPMYRHRVNAQRPNLIGLTMGEVDQPQRDKIPNNSIRIVMESDSRKRPALPHDGGLPSKKPWFDKPNFNKPNHQGYHKRPPFSANTKLLVRQIPPELNNISKLNEHFSKFGTIVNLQVAYHNDPEGALIQFASPDEAKRAMQSTEAVLNNRFIKVHWFRDDGSDGQGQGLSHSQQPQPQPAMVTTHVKTFFHNIYCLVMFFLNTHKKNVLGLSLSNCKCCMLSLFYPFQVFSTSTGLTKTVYNPAALKTAQKTSEEALKKKQEALRLQQDVRKKKQEILEKHIETQKLLISKLEKNKTMKAEDKAKIMETLGTLTKNITKLQEEIKGTSCSNNLPTITKSKNQAQKELLDAELDLYKKTQTGEDTALLKIKYTQLQIEAAKRGILSSGRGRGIHARGRGSIRARVRGLRGRGRGVPVHTVVDHRPRALEVSGFTKTDHVDLLPHFAQFGEIEDCQIDENNLSAVISYKTRAEAEQVMNRFFFSDIHVEICFPLLRLWCCTVVSWLEHRELWLSLLFSQY